MKIIDLTYNVEPGMPCFGAPWHVSYSYEIMGTIDTVGRNTRKFTIGSHTGTHMDAPKHFIKDGLSISDIDLSVTCGNVSILDFRGLPDGSPITRDMLKATQLSERVVVVFGWCCKWNTNEYYINYPYFTKDAAEYLIDAGVKFLAMDTPSPDNSSTKLLSKKDSEIHKLLLGNNVILVEYLANTDTIDTKKKYDIIALPMKMKDSDGSPARVILVEKE